MSDSSLVPRGSDEGAIVPRDSVQGRAASSTSLVVESADGALQATLRFVRRYRFRVEFSLEVFNAGDEQLLATIYARTKNGHEVPVEPVAVWIGARTEAYVTLALGELGAFSTQTLVVRLQGPNVHRRLEAAVPPLRGPLWAIGGAAVASLLFVLFAHARVHIETIVFPTVANAGTQVTLQYQTRNASQVSWELDDATQHRIDGGVLKDRSGSMQVRLPNATQAQQYIVTLHAQGLLGADQARATVAALANPTPQPQQQLSIRSISVDDANPGDGGRVTVRYETNATSGVVRLIDAQGIVWSSAPLSPEGVTTLPLPFFAQQKELQAQVVAVRGKEKTQAGVGVVVRPGPSAEASSAPIIGPGTPVVVIASTFARAGGTIDVAIDRHLDELQISLVDSRGRTIVAQNVSGEIGIVHIHVPQGVRGPVGVIATYTIGKSQASIIRRIPIVR